MPLALLVLAPVVVIIVAFHAFLASIGLGLTGVIVGLQLTLARNHRGTYRPLLKAHAKSG